MKKFLLSAVAAVMCALPTLADEISVTWSTLGLPTQHDMTSYNKDDVTFTFSNGDHSLPPRYFTIDSSVRFYVNTNATPPTSNTFTISVPEGFKLDMIVNECVKNYVVTATPSTGTLSTEGTTVSIWEPTEDTNEVTFKFTKASRVVTTIVTYSQVSGVVLEPAELSFPEEEYEAELGSQFNAPELSKVTDANAVYSSSHPEVASVDPTTGEVTLLSAGSTIITAECAANDVYRAGQASYTLIVKKPVVIAAGTYTIVCADAYREFVGSSLVMESDGIKILMDKAESQTAPAYNTTALDARVYAKGTVTVSAPAGCVLTDLAFQISVQGKKRMAKITADTGEVGEQYVTADEFTWSGKAKSVTFTVGDISQYGTESGSAGQFDFTAVNVTYDLESGVNEVENAESAATYFDLNGRQVKHPANGLFVKVVEGKASKVIVK